ncbi:uncharacterized protein LOC100118687 [Nasonia vitripennis]|uniref:Uncharacterized protein n=1 Tax=Nasonia vitripennis TaxID=7425 RepID=A0A7M7LQJ9_NASVI|nr:uncharacterized protein LOC100118687 [Nasonia vitripennis]XP_008204174.1 uncharacterized protein LOC100118687 [Nasonia vitripennis]XP_008204175.1 uncharacterized protein LOC100118687 [Nasonia vitripennis]
MAETNEEMKISEESQKHYERKMENFECPFTWGMSETICIDTDDIRGDNEEVIPLMKFMRCIALVYDYTRTNKDSQTILEKLNDCDDVIIKIQNDGHPHISIEAVLSVFKATKCFALLYLQMEPELKTIFAETVSIDSSEKKQTSTVKACRSIAWSNYSRTTKTIECIREAIADNPDCDLWHFILAKTLRSKRQKKKFNSQPDAEEIESFEKAYNTRKNPVFGVFLAKAYNEDRHENDKALKMIESLQDIPRNDSLLLIIVLIYIRMRDFKNAKSCFDKVANKKSSMYSHYRGLYFLKQKQYQEAHPFLKKAIETNNFQAEFNYMNCAQVIHKKRFDLTQYLLQMLDKYRSWSKHMLQTITLHLAYTYFKKDKNIKESLKYFLEAIEINPDAILLKETYRPVLLCDWPKKSIYKILSKNILPDICEHLDLWDEKTKERAIALEKYCNEHQPQL